MSRAHQFDESRAHHRRAGRAGGFGGGPPGTRLPDEGCRMVCQPSFIYEENGEPIFGKVPFLAWNREGDYFGRADYDDFQPFGEESFLQTDIHVYGGRGSILAYTNLQQNLTDGDGNIIESIDNTVFDSLTMARGKPNQWLFPESRYRARFGGQPSQRTFVQPCFYSGVNGFGDLSIAYEENGEGRIDNFRSLAFLTGAFTLVGSPVPYSEQTPFGDKRGFLHNVTVMDADVGAEYRDQRTGEQLTDADVIARIGLNESVGIRRRNNGNMVFSDIALGNSGGVRFADALEERLSRYEARIPVPIAGGGQQSWGGGIYTRWEAWMFVESGRTFHPIGVIGYVYDQYGSRFNSAPERWWGVCMGLSDVYSTTAGIGGCRVSVAGK